MTLGTERPIFMHADIHYLRACSKASCPCRAATGASILQDCATPLLCPEQGKLDAKSNIRAAILQQVIHVLAVPVGKKAFLAAVDSRASWM